MGTVLILNAIDMAGVEAAVDFAVRGALTTSVLAAQGRAIESRLHAHSIGGTASKTEIEAVREVQPGAIDVAAH